MADFSLLDIYSYFLSYNRFIREKQMGRLAIRCLSKGEFCLQLNFMEEGKKIWKEYDAFLYYQAGQFVP